MSDRFDEKAQELVRHYMYSSVHIDAVIAAALRSTDAEAEIKKGAKL